MNFLSLELFFFASLKVYPIETIQPRLYIFPFHHCIPVYYYKLAIQLQPRIKFFDKPVFYPLRKETISC